MENGLEAAALHSDIKIVFHEVFRFLHEDLKMPQTHDNRSRFTAYFRKEPDQWQTAKQIYDIWKFGINISESFETLKGYVL